jgi:spore maturation protein CgeB
VCFLFIYAANFIASNFNLLVKRELCNFLYFCSTSFYLQKMLSNSPWMLWKKVKGINKYSNCVWFQTLLWFCEGKDHVQYSSIKISQISLTILLWFISNRIVHQTKLEGSCFYMNVNINPLYYSHIPPLSRADHNFININFKLNWINFNK